MRSVLAKRNRWKVKKYFSKEENIPKASGDIMLRKGTDFDILYFDINIDRFYPAPVRLWLQNRPTAPPTPEVFLVSSSDSGCDCQWFCFAL